jgi:hypothetical protein
MTFNRSPRVTVFPDARTAATVVAARLSGAIQRHPAIVLGLATGRTPVPLYAELVRQSRARGLDWSAVTTFNLDEFAGLPGEHPGSYRSFMEQHLFAHVNLTPDRINFLDGMTDPGVECQRYEQAIAASGGDRPPDPGHRDERAHRVQRAWAAARVANASGGARAGDAPQQRLSVRRRRGAGATRGRSRGSISSPMASRT